MQAHIQGGRHGGLGACRPEALLPPRLQVPRPQPYSFMDFALAYALRNVFGQESGPENQSFMCVPALSLTQRRFADPYLG